MATSPPPTEPDTPRVLLFGHRGAGKSALIGALLQAGETQGETLRGEVVTSSVDLPRIRDAVYSGTQIEPVEPSQQELVSYTIRLRPWRVGTQPVGEPLTVILDDCDGKAAESLLDHPEPISSRQPDSPLARAVVGADALALLVDASSTEEELNEAFREFDTFLDVIALAKTEAREVGGFPVYLVLTQCDRLAFPGDSVGEWEDRVKSRTEAAWKAFEEFLKEAEQEDAGTGSPYLPFGSVDLTVIAVAVRQPPLRGAASTGNLPYRVAELFRDCFAGAKAHHERVQSSQRRLTWIVRLALGMTGFLLFSLAMIALFPPEPTEPTLAERVRDYAVREPTRAAVRLASDQLPINKRILQGFAADPDFARLDTDLQQFVEGRLKEIQDYEEYRGMLANALAPASTRTTPDLVKAREALMGPLAPPPQYDWDGTPAANLRAKFLADTAAIAEAVRVLEQRYHALREAANDFLGTRSFDTNWLEGIDALVAQGSRPLLPLHQTIPGSPAVNQPRGEAVTYSVPYEFDEVFKARRRWEQKRDQLLHLRDLADALGATTAPNRPEPVLQLPEPGPNVDSAKLPGERWTALQRIYTRQSEGYPEWDVSDMIDPTRSELTTRLQRSFDAGVRHLRKLMKVEDTKEGWKALAGLLSQPAFRDWGRFLHLLARLQNPSAVDPVAELAGFLNDLDNKVFELDLRGFDLIVPRDLTVGLDRVVPVGPLTVTVSKGKEVRDTAKFTLGKGEPRGTDTVYKLTPVGTGKLKYFAGDELRAELPAKAGARDVKLLWGETGASGTFQFDRLERQPRITRPTGGTDAATGVQLIPSSASTIPKFPVLMPLRGATRLD